MQKVVRSKIEDEILNYYAIYGTRMGETVKAESQLAVEFHHTLV